MAVLARARRMVRSDLSILLIVTALLVVGLVMVYSASYGFSLFEGGPYYGRPAYFVRQQAIFAAIGLIGMLVASRIDYRLYQRCAVPLLVLTVLVLVPMALGVGRWVFPQARRLQVSEFARLGALVYIAVWLASKGDELRELKLGLLPFAVLLGVIAGLIVLQPDFSTAFLLTATATAMFFVAGADVRQVLLALLIGGLVALLVALAAPYRSQRVDLWLGSPFQDPLGAGFQVIQALVALNRGGWAGVGLGQSQQKYAIYAPHTDGMFAIIGEEAGFLGALLIIGLYVLWTWRGLRVAWHTEDVYGMTLAVGIVCWVSFQAALHVAVITAATPFTGTVLPLVSYGGSSLVATLTSVGVLLNISRGHRAGERVP